MYLLDTNAVINYMNASMPAAGMQFMHTVVDAKSNISIITKMEVLGFEFQSPAEHKLMWAFISGCNILTLTDDVVNKTIAIRSSKKMKLPDAIIASTAIVHKLTLVTRNVTDFNNITGLRVINPWVINTP